MRKYIKYELIEQQQGTITTRSIQKIKFNLNKNKYKISEINCILFNNFVKYDKIEFISFFVFFDEITEKPYLK